ncbi:MAG: Sua5/YciO/YrdC/YwlC family protein [Desulfobacterales bacterium]|nr:Sua5/YciO/YrdC/YwlC family protein [Desulfobacterales bacterium]
MQRFWPGRLTLVLDARPGLPARLTAGTGKIGIRLAAHPVARALAEAVAQPITGTSANLSGGSGCRQIAELDPRIARQVDLILDGGALKGGVGSTVVDVTGETPVVIREGEVSKAGNSGGRSSSNTLSLNLQGAVRAGAPSLLTSLHAILYTIRPSTAVPEW